MESLMATDWLKDYDSLFDMFDEEMRCAGQVDPNEYLNEYDLNNYYNPHTKPFGHDEVNLLLSLEWLPLLDIAGQAGPSTSGRSADPSNSTTPANSSLPSPTGSLTSSSCSAAIPSSSSASSTQSSSSTSPCVIAPNPSSSSHHCCSAHACRVGPITCSCSDVKTCCTNTGGLIRAGCSGANVSTDINSNSINYALARALKKKKKRCGFRSSTKGTSLLAPRPANNGCPESKSFISSRTISSASSSSKVPFNSVTHSSETTATTILTATPTPTNEVTFVAKVASGTIVAPTLVTPSKRKQAQTPQVTRLVTCIRIEHAYSLSN